MTSRANPPNIWLPSAFQISEPCFETVSGSFLAAVRAAEVSPQHRDQTGELRLLADNRLRSVAKQRRSSGGPELNDGPAAAHGPKPRHSRSVDGHKEILGSVGRPLPPNAGPKDRTSLYISEHPKLVHPRYAR